MSEQDELLTRVREDVRAISSLASGKMNVPLENYIDKISLDALCDSFSVQSEFWRVEDLEKILIIRDGLYTLRNKLRDDGDEGEHSVDQLLSAMDRLYADLERAMRALNAQDVQEAQKEIAALQRTPQVDSQLVPLAVSELRNEASELLTRTHITYQRFELNLIKINRLSVNFEVLRNATLSVQRLSASVFAIKLSLEQNVIYQGIVRFLSESADKIVDELRGLAERFQKSYKQATDFISDLTALVERGSRFTHHVAEFLRDIFADKPLDQKQMRLKTRTALGNQSMLAACRIDDRRLLLGGKDGYVNVVDVPAGKIIDQHRVSQATINCLARTRDTIIAGTDRGLGTINPQTLVSLEHETVYQENVTAIAAPASVIVSGTRDGILRRWRFNDSGLQRYGSENLRGGKSVQRMLLYGDQVMIAAGEEILFVGDDFQISRREPLDFLIRDMCFLAHDTLIVCGEGKLAQVNLARGVYTRFIFASQTASYSCVAPIDDTTFCAGTRDGTLTAIDVNSNGEIGSAKLPFPIRGIVKGQQNLIAYGGNWEGKSANTIALLTWEEILHKAKEVTRSE